MNAYIWHVDDKVAHHMRAESITDVRERIAATHGEDTAQRAIIKTLHPGSDSTVAAA